MASRERPARAARTAGIAVAVLLAALAGASAGSCACKDASLCKPIQAGPRKEVFAFSVNNTTWRSYDWSRLTTVALFTPLDPEMLCTAHAHGVRVVFSGSYPTAQLLNATARQQWISDWVQRVQDAGVDGVNVDYESPLQAGSAEVAALTQLVGDLRDAMHAAVAGSQVTFDVAWSPDCIDGRCFDYKGLADATDALFVMDYDTRSQIRGACVAAANSPLATAVSGVRNYTALGIPPSKLILGFPWYGYDYPCQGVTDPAATTCPIKPVPFRGVPCSDAAGAQVCLSGVLPLAASNATVGPRWDGDSQSWTLNYRRNGTVHQVWYDDAKSLSIKYAYAAQQQLRGVGMWQADCLAYSSTDPTVQQQNKMMWTAFDAFLHPSA